MKNLRFKNQIALAVAALVCSSLVSAAPYSFRAAVPGIKPTIPPAPTHVAVNFNATSTGRSGTIQTWTVPATGTYTVVLAGAAGGVETYNSFTPGLGGVLTSKLALTQGTVLKILVGQVGEGSYYRGGGGGGTYLVSSATALAVAGGGGGAGTDGGAGYNAAMSATASHGGGYNTGWGGGGAGFSADGMDGGNYGGMALSFLDGGTGGGTASYPFGGFGGGGGGGGNGGGGGGGYTANSGAGGAGGSSYTSGTLVSFAATNSGTGYASFTLN